ncbi:MAG: ATP-binding cassette domain-containing protein [Eubacterium ramulus]
MLLFPWKKGELAVILGASGAGKTTALIILGGMDTATSGKCWWTAQMSPLLANVSVPSTDAWISVLSFSFTIWCQI